MFRDSRWAALVVALALATFVAVGFNKIDGSLPYPQEGDEAPIINGAARILQSGSWNPAVYSYPSLPVYLIAAFLGLGYVAEDGQSHAHIRLAKLGKLESPYYDHPRTVATARRAWVMMAALALLAVALTALRVGGPWVMAASAIISLVSATNLKLAWTYLNVDVPLTMFGALCVFHLVDSAGERSFRERAWIPGMLCGLATACKYTGFVLVIPCLLAIWLFSTRDRVRQSIVLVATTVLTFFVACPFFLLDLHSFLEGLAQENWHYHSRGHSGAEGVPGLPQLGAYLGRLFNEYGIGLCLLAIAGCVSLLRKQTRVAAVILCVCAVWLGFLSNYKVFFIRNALLVIILVPLFSAAGIGPVTSQLTRWIETRGPRNLAHHASLCGALVMAVVIAATLPYARMGGYLRPQDSRNRFVAWAEEHFAPRTRVLIPKTLPIAPATLPRQTSVQVVDFSSADAVRGSLRQGRDPTYVLVPVLSNRAGWPQARIKPIRAGLALLPERVLEKSFEGTPFLGAGGGSVNPGFDVFRLKRARPSAASAAQ